MTYFVFPFLAIVPMIFDIIFIIKFNVLLFLVLPLITILAQIPKKLFSYQFLFEKRRMSMVNLINFPHYLNLYFSFTLKIFLVLIIIEAVLLQFNYYWYPHYLHFYFYFVRQNLCFLVKLLFFTNFFSFLFNFQLGFTLNFFFHQ